MSQWDQVTAFVDRDKNLFIACPTGESKAILSTFVSENRAVTLTYVAEFDTLDAAFEAAENRP